MCEKARGAMSASRGPADYLRVPLSTPRCGVVAMRVVGGENIVVVPYVGLKPCIITRTATLSVSLRPAASLQPA